nr:ABC transporter ABCA.10 [Dictyostelium discoideum]
MTNNCKITFKNQLKALLGKAILLKKKKRKETITEFTQGIQYIIVLVILHYTIPNVITLNTYSPVGLGYPTSGFPLCYVSNVPFNQTSNLHLLLNSTQLPISQIVQFPNEQSLIDSYKSNPQSITYGISFNNIDYQNNILDYNILLNSTFQNTQLISIVQNLFLSTFAEIKGITTTTTTTLSSIEEFPNLTSSVSVSSYLYVIYLPLLFLFSLQQLLVTSVTERKNHIKEVMKVMGLKELVYWVTIIIVQTITNVINILLVMVVLYFTKTLTTSLNPVMLFLQFLLYSFSMVAIGIILSNLVDTPKTASAISSFLLLILVGVSCFYQFYLKSKTSSSWLRSILFLFSPCAFGEFLYKMGNDQQMMLTTNWSDPQVKISFLFLIIDIFLYFTIAWYITELYKDNTDENSITKSFTFFLSLSYWKSIFNLRSSSSSSSLPLLNNNNNCNNNNTSPSSSSSSQSSPLNKPLLSGDSDDDENDIGIRLVNLKKTYKNPITKETVNAVNDVSYTIKKGTILALLGQNGSGKTSTIGMLNGMRSPSSGDAFINGLSIKYDMDKIRENGIGLCHQSNILYDEFTCAEHIALYSRLKGLFVDGGGANGDNKRIMMDNFIMESLGEVNLVDKKDTQSIKLSGGMKKKLCLPISLIGNPSILLLDEPSSGLDSLSQHMICELLQRKKPNKTIILTTHNLNSAELLGDKICIMTSGKVKAMGSSLELKNQFNLGYILTIVYDKSLSLLQPPNINQQFESFFFNKFNDSTQSKQNLKNIQSFYNIFNNNNNENNSNNSDGSSSSSDSSSSKDVLLNIKNNNNNNNNNEERGFSSGQRDLELEYSLTHQSTDVITEFLEELESRQDEFKIKRISMSMTTLDEVFLKVSEEETINKNKQPTS